MENENETNGKFWLNKKVKLFISKDGKDLVFTATILEIDNSHITFIDRDDIVYSFNRELITEMKNLGVQNDAP